MDFHEDIMMPLPLRFPVVTMQQKELRNTSWCELLSLSALPLLMRNSSRIFGISWQNFRCFGLIGPFKVGMVVS